VTNGHARVFTPAETRKWEADLAMMAQASLPPGRISGPIRVDILAVFARTKELAFRYKDGRWKHGEEMIWHTSKPDGDNIRKAVLDALRSFWGDDAQVVCGEMLKAWAEADGRARVVVRIRSINQFYRVTPTWEAIHFGLF
jgi:Holliday junction resolvase RusA-like endonuclease